MSLLILFLILALLFGIGGAVKGIAWFFFIAFALILIGMALNGRGSGY